MLNGNDVLTVPTVGPNGSPGQPVSPPMLPPLAVTALLVTKADLVQALRVYVPQLSDLESIQGDRFLLHMGPASDAAPGEDGLG